MGKLSGRNKLLMNLVGEEIERMSCRFGDDSGKYNTLSKYDAEQLLEMVKACKFGNLYSQHNLTDIVGLFGDSCINGRIDVDAEKTAKAAKRLAMEYLDRIGIKPMIV